MRVPSVPLLMILTAAAGGALVIAARGPQLATQSALAPGANIDAVRQNNLGVAFMSQQRFEPALQAFRQAAARDARLVSARLNQGIALLNLQRYDEARAALQEVTARDATSVRGWYNLGLLLKNLGEAEAALDAFRRAARLRPDEADVHYFVGLLSAQFQKYDLAIPAFQRALEINRFHASAEFGLARAYQRQGDAERARRHLDRFQEMTQSKVGIPMGLAYGDQGVYSTAELVRLPFDTAGAAPTPAVRFARMAGALGRPTDPGLPLGPGACAADVNNDGRPDVVVTQAGADRRAVLFENSRGTLRESPRLETFDTRDAIACAAGDFDNDEWIDLALSTPNRLMLLRNAEGRGFVDATATAGWQPTEPQAGLTWVDYDHDGDLDLYVARSSVAAAGAGGNRLWRNNGDGTFADQTAATGLAGSGPTLGAALSDFNNDRAVDLVLASASPRASVMINPREGPFEPRTLVPDLPAPVVGVAIADFDKDGWMDLVFTHGRAPGVTLWRNREGTALEPVTLPVELARAWGAAAIDYDNDGWIDLAVAGEPRLVLLRNAGPGGFVDRTAAAGLSGLTLAGPRALITADFDGDGDSDLLVTQAGGAALVLVNEGGNRQRWLRVALKGLHDNRSAIGTKVEIFSAPLWQKFEVGASGYLGQSSLEVLAGLGVSPELKVRPAGGKVPSTGQSLQARSGPPVEIVRLLWPTGVVQDEVNLEASQAHAITELDRRGSSCPILFTWNGERYEFVADAIGPGIIGHWVGPGERNVSDPTEFIRVEGTRVRPRAGRLSFRFMEPMEEIVYLDHIRLVAVDHPASVEVYPHEFFASGPPFPTGRAIASRAARLPAGAWDDRGRAVLRELRARDRDYVRGFDSASQPFKGFARPHALELELGAWDAHRPLRLLMHGFTDYFTATSVYAAQQAGIGAVVPYVDALEASGTWRRVADDIGFPAGLARTMVADLTGRLPAGTRRIRIGTNLKIYWDQILIDSTVQDVPMRQHDVPLASASLDHRGYPREMTGTPAADLRYVYEEVSRTGPYARHAGAYTRYGDVAPLLGAADDRFAILASGDEVALEFDPAALPTAPRGWTRDYFFYADGFAKDMDFYAAFASSVAPLPYHTSARYPYARATRRPATAEDLRYQLEWNTREVSGREGRSFRFEFTRP